MNHHHFPAPAPARWQDLTPDGKDAAVRALAATGLTAAAMAAILGTTKNAVLSVANRRKIAVGADIPVTTYSSRLAARAFQPGREVAPETWAPLAEPVAEPTRRQCCWPVGDAAGSAQMFCGLPKAGRSYCTTHTAMASGRRAHDHPYVDMLRAAPAEVTIEEAVALVRPVMKRKQGAE